MKPDYSTADGQLQLMRESVGQPTDFRIHASSGFKEGQRLEWRDLNLRSPNGHALIYLREGKPYGNMPTVVVKFPHTGAVGELLARDVIPMPLPSDWPHVADRSY